MRLAISIFLLVTYCGGFLYYLSIFTSGGVHTSIHMKELFYTVMSFGALGYLIDELFGIAPGLQRIVHLNLIFAMAVSFLLIDGYYFNDGETCFIFTVFFLSLNLSFFVTLLYNCFRSGVFSTKIGV